MGTFQNNVRATFNVRRYAGRVGVASLAATFFLSLAIGRASDALLAYFLFFLVMYVVAIDAERLTGRSLTAHASLRLKAIFRPILFMVPVVLVAYIVLYVFTGMQVSPGSAGEKLWPAFFASVIVGFVEEFARFVWLQVLPLSVLSGNLLWVLLHPQVAVVFNGSAPNLLFAVFAFVFGLAMTAIMWSYESRLPGRVNEGLGPIAAMVLHAGYNVLVVVWAVAIAGVTFGVM